MEEYKKCFEDYEISNLGNLRKKLKDGNYKEIKGSILNTGGGYKYFQIKRNGKRINKLFHHLVAEQFIGQRPNNLVIDHIDRNPLNNNINNLRYITQKENTHNTDKYRSDIIEKDENKRANILERERYWKKNGERKRREKGTGGIIKRTDTKKDVWVVQLTKNKIHFRKQFYNEDEAKQYLKSIF
jgi:hypothetical protein